MSFTEYTPDKETHTLVFAYGSNMDPKQMWERCPSASVVGKGVLNNYNRDYSKWSTIRSCGVENVQESGGDHIMGVIWDIPTSELHSLAEYEESYIEKTLSVYSYENQKNIACIVFIAKPEGEFKPSYDYLQKVKAGETFLKALPTYKYNHKMKSFREHINEAVKEGKNVHIMHIEDQVIYGGVKGCREAIFALRSLRDMLAGHSGSSLDIAAKFDGCIHKDTLVVTQDSVKKVSDLTNEDFIKCYDIDTHTTKYYNNTMPRITGGSKDWVEVILEDGSSFICTEDHPLLTKDNQYIEAIDCLDEDI